LNSQIEALKKQNLELESLVSTLKTSTPTSRPIEPLLTQLEEMRSSHSAERQLREKEIRKLNADLKAERRYTDQSKKQLTDLETELSRYLARIREQADELNSCQKEVPIPFLSSIATPSPCEMIDFMFIFGFILRRRSVVLN
jgi:hypothetical protein